MRDAVSVSIPGTAAVPAPLTLRLPTAEDTRAEGRRLAAVLRPGDLVVLTGPLGAGKTAYAQGVGAALGVRGAVTSPTFVIARVHPPDPVGGGTVPLVHVDAYRLGGTDDPTGELDDLDLDADLARSITLVEWGEGLAERLVDDHLQVRIDRHGGSGDETGDVETRTVTYLPSGGDWAERLAGLTR
jgi:tRNA threonylcarbamoyladenosine biosynthesis protein TsaE